SHCSPVITVASAREAPCLTTPDFKLSSGPGSAERIPGQSHWSWSPALAGLPRNCAEVIAWARTVCWHSPASPLRTEASAQPALEEERANSASSRDIGREVRVPTGLSPHAGKYALAVMVKAPRSGEVKTRLVPPLRAEEASLLSACFVKDIVANLLSVSESV